VDDPEKQLDFIYLAVDKNRAALQKVTDANLAATDLLHARRASETIIKAAETLAAAGPAAENPT